VPRGIVASVETARAKGVTSSRPAATKAGAAAPVHRGGAGAVGRTQGGHDVPLRPATNDSTRSSGGSPGIRDGPVLDHLHLPVARDTVGAPGLGPRTVAICSPIPRSSEAKPHTSGCSDQQRHRQADLAHVHHDRLTAVDAQARARRNGRDGDGAKFLSCSRGSCSTRQACRGAPGHQVRSRSGFPFSAAQAAHPRHAPITAHSHGVERQKLIT
jgi:hypothetical protein